MGELKPCSECGSTTYRIHTTETRSYACTGMDEEGSPDYGDELGFCGEVIDAYVRCANCFTEYPYEED